MNPDDQIKQQKITPAMILEKKASHQRIVCLTAYDYPTAKLVDAAGMDMILVGDTLSEVVLGNKTTLPVTVDEMLYHTRAVRRAVRFALLIGDLPYGSYHVSEKDAVSAAMRFIKEAAVEAIKLEGGQKRIEVVRRLIDAEIPVIGHLGLTPQSIYKFGGYKVQAKREAEIEQIIDDALALDKAGVFAIVLEGVPREVAAVITGAVSAATIGIGAGPDCDGQILVINDVLGLSFGKAPKFVRKYAEMTQEVARAVRRFESDVKNRVVVFPSDACLGAIWYRIFGAEYG
jgi:3-methyl-2-oxobutanoate hydroxymethyltransferase